MAQAALLVASGFAALGYLFAKTRPGPQSRTPIVHFPPSPALLPIRKNKNSPDPDWLSLRSLVENHCPGLFSDFHPLWWLPNGHLQTIYCVLGDFTKHDLVQYERKYLRLLDGGTLGLDFCPAHPLKLADDIPIIVVKHGLTGGSYESYVRAILYQACAPVENGGLGYRAVVVNFRGCAGVPITSPQMYSAGHTDDLRQALIFIASLYPKAPLIGIGFSLGANVMTRYLAEEGNRSRLVAGCALACPWDLEKNNAGLSSSLVGKLYSKGMGSNLLKVLKQHVDALQRHPEHSVAKAVSLTLALKNPTIDEFDDSFTRIAGGSAPNFPFDSAQDYYRWASSHYVLQKIRVPFLTINAADDPIVRNVPLDGVDNGYVIMTLTPAGGHLGWFQAGNKVRIGRWTTKPVLEWFKVMAEDLVHSNTTTRTKLYLDDDGFLKEESKNFLGCKEIEGSEIIDTVRGAVGSLQGL